MTKTNAPEITAPKGELKHIKLSLLMPSPTNPRKTFAEAPLRELADSIKALGVKQPLLVRPLPRYSIQEPDLVTKLWRLLKDETPVEEFHQESAARSALVGYAGAHGRQGREYEIICGERRFRASGLAGAEVIPCMVEKLDDQTVEKIQLIENLQREDLTPIEEAQGYRDLMDRHKWTVPDIQKHLQKSRSHVFAKLALLKITPKVRKALEDARISASVGELIGRYPGAKLQEKALQLILDNSESTYVSGKDIVSPLSYRAAAALLQEEFTVDLGKAEFDVKKEYIGAPNGEPCAGCPYRSGNARDQYPDIQSADICLSPDCYKKKTELHRDAKLEGFRKKGIEVLPASESQKLFPHGDWLHGGQYAEVGSANGLELAKRLKKHLPAPVIALNRSGKPVQLIRIADVKKNAAAAGIQLELGNRNGETPEEKAKRERAEKEEAEIRVRCLAAAAAAIGLGKKNREALRWLITAELYDFEPGMSFGDGANLKKATANLDVTELVCALVKSACGDYLDGDITEDAVEVAEAMGVDVKKIKKEVKDDFNTAGELGLKSTLRLDGFKFNEHGVCTNPEQLEIPGMPKGTKAVLRLAKWKEDWCLGYDYQNNNKERSAQCRGAGKNRLALSVHPSGAIREELVNTRSFFKGNAAALKAIDAFDKSFVKQYGLDDKKVREK